MVDKLSEVTTVAISYSHQKMIVRITVRNVCHEGTSVISNLTESSLECLIVIVEHNDDSDSDNDDELMMSRLFLH